MEIPFVTWVLPEVGSSHVIGLHTKEDSAAVEDPDVTVLEDEVDSASHMTLAEIEVIREQAYEKVLQKVGKTVRFLVKKKVSLKACSKV